MRITRMPCSSFAIAETQPKNDVHTIDDATFVSRKKISFLVQNHKPSVRNKRYRAESLFLLVYL